MIWLDDNADAPVLPAAWSAFEAASRDGSTDPRALLRELGVQLGAGGLHLCSGGTEAVFRALRSALRPGTTVHVVTSTLEHPAITANLAELERRGRARVTRVAPGADGRVAAQELLSCLEPDTALVSLVAASSETGVLQPVAEVAAACRGLGVLVHTDAVQLLGHTAARPSDLGADIVSFAAHKLGGMGGLGGNWVREGVALASPEALEPFALPSVPLLAALVAALAERPSREELATIAARRDRLEASLGRVTRIEVLGAAAPRLCNTSCVRLVDQAADAALIALDLAGVAASMGSACSSGALEASPALLSMGLSRAAAREVLRFSLARSVTDAEVDATVDVLARFSAG